MSSSTATQIFTAEQLLQMPKDGYRYELIEGALIKMSPAGSKHGQVALTVAGLLWQHVRAHKLGVVLLPRRAIRSPAILTRCLRPTLRFATS
jgi:Uma2 family endonuclease